MSLWVERIATLVGVGVVALLLGLAVLLLAQTVVACAMRRRPPPIRATGGEPRPRIAILMPAHDEAGGIEATLATLVPQLAPSDRLVVVADNCSDATADVARRVGVDVVERRDTVLRGKGYALDFGLASLRADPPDVVLMFDADCVAGPGCVATLAIEAQRTRRPVQAFYLIRAPDGSVRARLGEFAYRLRNWVRPLGMAAVGLPCQLMGSGMAFHWTLFDAVSLASGHLTEDLQLGLAFARLGQYPRFCPEATVDSPSVSDAAGAVVQRTRWEHGHLGTIVHQWPSLALQAVRRLDVRLACMTWDLAVPPLALFSMVQLVAGVLALGLGVVTGVWWPAVGVGVALVLLLATIVLAQRFFAQDLIGLDELFFALPAYLVRKVPIYFQFVFRRQAEWIRSKRDVG